MFKLSILQQYCLGLFLLSFSLLACGEDSENSNSKGDEISSRGPAGDGEESEGALPGIDDPLVTATRAPDTSDLMGERWLIAIYMAADNNLDEAAAMDLNELIDAGVPNNTEVVVFIDRSSNVKYRQLEVTDIGWFDDAKIIKISSLGVQILEEYGELDSADPGTLKLFINYINEYHYSDEIRKAFILWDHGGVTKFAQDESAPNPNRLMSIKDIAYSFVVGEDDGNLRFLTFDILGFDACLMSSIESVLSFGAIAPIFIASAEIEPGPGWDYFAMMNSLRNPNITPRELAIDIVNSYKLFFDRYPESKAGFKITLSAWKINSFDIFSSLQDFINALNQISDQESLVQSLKTAESNTVKFGKTKDSLKPTSMDLGLYLEFFGQKISDTNTRNAISSFNQIILDHRIAHISPERPQSTGISFDVQGSNSDENEGRSIFMDSGWGDFEEIMDNAVNNISEKDDTAPDVNIRFDEIDPDNGFILLGGDISDDTVINSLDFALVYDDNTSSPYIIYLESSLEAIGNTSFALQDFMIPLMLFIMYPESDEQADVQAPTLMFDGEDLYFLVYLSDGEFVEYGAVVIDLETWEPAGIVVFEENGTMALLDFETMLDYGIWLAPLGYNLDGEELAGEYLDPYDLVWGFTGVDLDPGLKIWISSSDISENLTETLRIIP